jgi:dolichyl-phosphate-mannose--protein O-mannosyl transferase
MVMTGHIIAAMSNSTKWTLRLGGAALTMASAVALLVAPTVLWFTVPVICVWVVWLVFDYMQWARTLGR